MGDNMQSRIIQLREQRIAREKARLDKLREMNIKKYGGDDIQAPKLSASSSVTSTNRPSSIPLTKRRPSSSLAKPRPQLALSKPQHPPSIPDILTEVNKTLQEKKTVKTVHKTLSLTKQIDNLIHRGVTNETSRKSIAPQAVSRVVAKKIAPSEKADKAEVKKPDPRKSIAPPQTLKPQRKTILPSEMATKPNAKALARKTLAPIDIASKVPARKSLMPIRLPKPDATKSKPIVAETKTSLYPPKVTQSASKLNGKRESVFDRLYKPKPVNDKVVNNALKLRTDAKYCDKVIRDSNLIANKRHTVFEPKKHRTAPVRRSISAVHFKRIPRSELVNCITKWSSSDNVNKTPLKEIDEDELVKRQEKLISAVKSERKKVTFQRQSIHNGPTPAELQSRLKHWLQKRGKSIDSYHHLQCFGLHHLVQTEKEFRPYDEEDKENVSMTSDSDDGSYSEAMNDETKENKWRRASYVTEFDETPISMASHEEAHDTTELVNGALSDLTEILREGFDWEQSARWLRAIRERFPSVGERAAYWECRAALEESQGNLPASVQCWEEAIAKGTERTVVEANLDQLLDKFMRLNISPRSEEGGRAAAAARDKMVDVRNVFKSTIIRFAVQQAKLRQSGQHEAPAYTVTPVRRSNRLSRVATPRTVPRAVPRAVPRTPLVQICHSLRQADAAVGGKARFVHNATLPNTP